MERGQRRTARKRENNRLLTRIRSAFKNREWTKIAMMTRKRMMSKSKKRPTT